MEQLEKLSQLGDLLQKGAITQTEFDNLKKQILSVGTSTKTPKEVTKPLNVNVGILTIVFKGASLPLVDAKVQISVNGKSLEEQPSFRKGFSVKIPIESSTIKLKIKVDGRHKTFTLEELELNKNYSIELEQGKFLFFPDYKFKDIKISQNG